MISNEEYTRYRGLSEFREWVEDITRVISKNPELLKRSRARAPSDVLLNKFYTEAVPLWMFFKNQERPENVRIALSLEDLPWDALVFGERNSHETRIQITTTDCEQMALTRLHMNEYGDAPITHAIQTRKGLAQWKKEKGRVDLIAVNTRSEVEREIGVIADRIIAKSKKDYPSGTVLLVYSYLDFTEEHFTPDEMKTLLLVKFGDNSLEQFAEIHLAQPRRNIQIK